MIGHDHNEVRVIVLQSIEPMVNRSHTFLHHLRNVTFGCLMFTGVVGCRDITDSQLPDGVESPSMYNNREGAVRLTQSVMGALSGAIREYIIESGLLTDELNADGSSHGWADQRRSYYSIRPVTEPYGTLHEVRSLARLARGIVTKYVSGETSSWQGTLFLYEAYAEILLADGWCSGVPLSTMDFEADWTYRAGSTTTDIYKHAIVLLDSAYAHAADSLPLQFAIQTLKARAFVALGRYPDAKAVVEGIGADERFPLQISFQAATNPSATTVSAHLFVTRATVSDREGINGLPYLSVRDPRTFVDSIRVPAGTGPAGVPSHVVWFPRKYMAPDSTSFVITSGIEARLIEAEALLHEDNLGGFLTALNTLRTTGSYSSIDTVFNGPAIVRIDTAWVAGTGGVAGLRPLADPGSVAGRLTLLFSERAAWLFVTGNRQGDLRRLIRMYGHDPESVYPTGAYMGTSETGTYGADISLAIPAAESRNPLFRGCLNHD